MPRATEGWQKDKGQKKRGRGEAPSGKESARNCSLTA
jgi:hypothetical protein